MGDAKQRSQRGEMDNKLRNILGLLNGGSRSYQLKDGEVDRADFEYCITISQVLFGERGLVETLGPTWDMVHDPRFEVLENVWIDDPSALLGGDARTGIQRQQKDGTFDGGFAAIEKYTEMLGEGRNMIKFLRCRAILTAVHELFPDRSLRVNARDSFGPLALIEPYTPGIREKLVAIVSASDVDGLHEDYLQMPDATLSRLAFEYGASNTVEELGVLSHTEKQVVEGLADSYDIYQPHALKDLPEDELWKLLFAEYTNYFTRAGKPNPLARKLFNLFRADLCGLVADYAEVANVQETVLLEDTAELYEPSVHGEEAARVSMEVENLERALSYRAELRVTAYQVLNNLGIGSQLKAHDIELTDDERDKFTKIIFESDIHNDRAATVNRIMGYIWGIKLLGLTKEQREAQQLTEAKVSAMARIEGLKNGTILPISRHTEEVVNDEAMWSKVENMIRRVLADPIAGYAFSRLTGIEKRLELAKAQFSPLAIDETTGQPIPVNEFRQDVMNGWIDSATNPDVVVYSSFQPTEEDLSQLRNIEALVKAQHVLRPVFEDETFVWTDEVATALLTRVEHLDPTPGMPEVTQFPEGADPGAAVAN